MKLIILLLVCIQLKGQPIGILTYGEISNRQALITALQKEIKRVYGKEIVVVGLVGLPKRAYYKPRQRYIADTLVNDAARYKGYSTILAITAKDISTDSPNWGICGLAGDYSCMVSMFRTKTIPVFVDVAIHEIGHTIGYYHCKDVTCFMQAYDGTLRVHKKFCKQH